MLRNIPRPIGSIGFVTTLLVLGVGVGAPGNTARADDCLIAPNSSAPQGRHWYYYLDRTNQRKCWYLRAPDLPEQQAAAQATSDAAATHNCIRCQRRPHPCLRIYHRVFRRQ